MADGDKKELAENGISSPIRTSIKILGIAITKFCEKEVSVAKCAENIDFRGMRCWRLALSLVPVTALTEGRTDVI